MHCHRLKLAREAALRRNGGLAAARALADATRRQNAAEVDKHIRAEAQRRSMLMVSAYKSSAGKPQTRPKIGLEVSKEMLGEGATSTVWRARFGPGRSEVAAKVVRKEELNEEQRQWIRDEMCVSHTHTPRRAHAIPRAIFPVASSPVACRERVAASLVHAQRNP
jgi:hypothetical protein